MLVKSEVTCQYCNDGKFSRRSEEDDSQGRQDCEVRGERGGDLHRRAGPVRQEVPRLHGGRHRVIQIQSVEPTNPVLLCSLI